MGMDYFSNEYDSSAKAEELCRKVCVEFGYNAETCNTVDPQGNSGYKIGFSVLNGHQINVYFKARLSNLQGISDKMLVWSYVAPLINVPRERKEDFLMRLLAINMESDTCAVGINNNNVITVKAERILSGLDLHELKDMINSTFSVAQKLQIDVCPEYKVATAAESEVPQDKKIQKQEVKPSAGNVLSPAQTELLSVLNGCNKMIEQKQYNQAFKLFFQTTTKVLESLKQTAGSKTADEEREKLELALSDLVYYNDDQAKCAMFKKVFEEVINLKA